MLQESVTRKMFEFSVSGYPIVQRAGMTYLTLLNRVRATGDVPNPEEILGSMTERIVLGCNERIAENKRKYVAFFKKMKETDLSLLTKLAIEKLPYFKHYLENDTPVNLP